MTAIITEKFKQHNATQFFESFSEAASDAYYLFIGKSTAFTTATSGGTDTNPPTPIDGVSPEFYNWDAMLAAKKITTSDITYAVPRRNWSNGTVFDMYDDTVSASNLTTSGSSNLYSSSFYFVTTDFNVYKVLDNNGGVAYNGTEPTSTSNSPFESGGYVLKYMYTVSASDAVKFATTDFVPVSTNATVAAAATDGKIESLSITAGSGYTDGTYYAAVYGDGANQGTASGAIVRMTVVGGQIQNFGLSAGSDTTIHAGGSGYTFGTVNLGSAYTYSDAALTTLSSMGAGTGGVVRIIVSPKGGHGSDSVEELGGHFVISNITLTQAEGDDFTTANDYRQIGIVKNPTLYGTSTVGSASTYRQTAAVKFSSVSGAFIVDEIITQTTTGAVGRVVEYDSVNNILYINQERYGDYGTNSATGAYVAFSGTNNITGSTSSAVGTPSTTASETVTLLNSNTVTFTSGYVTPDLQPDSGEILYIENRKPIQRVSDQTEDIKIIIEF